jgi:hypothetical protein
MMGTSTVPLNVAYGAICKVIGRLWMIRYVEKWNTPKYEEEEVVDAGHGFFRRKMMELLE